MTSLKTAALALVAMLTIGCSSATAIWCGSATAKPSSSAVCTTSVLKGKCGPYANYPQITGTTSSTHVGNNVWNPITGEQQTLTASSPGTWQVTANMPAGHTGVVSYPSLGANYGHINDTPSLLSGFSSIYSSFTENMNATSRSSAWAAYDIWLGQGTASSATHEVMIQHDFARNGACTAVATAYFGGSGGVTRQKWNLCQFGSELVWKLSTNERVGTVNILAMLTWLVHHRYLPQNSGLWSIGYGWEICSTGGKNETFQVNRFSITTRRSSS